MNLHNKAHAEFKIALGSWLLAISAFAFAFCTSAQLSTTAKDATATPAATAKHTAPKTKTEAERKY